MAKFTTTHNIPIPLRRMIEHSFSNHSMDGADVSVTQLFDAPLVRWMWEHFPDIEQNFEDCLWLALGTVTHGILAQFGEGGTAIVEKAMVAEIGGMKVVGHFDIIEESGVLFDYKLTSLYAVDNAERIASWGKQLNAYALLRTLTGYPPPTAMNIVAIMRDWGPRFSKTHPCPIEIIPIAPIADIGDQVAARVAIHKANPPDGAMPEPCSTEETWNGRKCKGYCPFGKSGVCPYVGAGSQ